MNRVALDLGIIQIYWYSLMIFLGVLVACIFIFRETRKQNINEDFMLNLIFYSVVFGLIGARAYYVAFNWSYYSTHLLEILEVWNGGLAIHGGIFAGLLWIIFYTKKYKISTLKILDIAVVGLMIGQCIGRWGNFFNQEAYGAVTTLEALQGMYLPDFIIQGMYIDGAYRIPTFLYESIWTFFGFIALLIIRRYRYLKTGQLTGFYLIWYSLGRFVIEGMRTDSLMLGNFRVAQLISVMLFVIGVLLFIFARRGSKFDNLYEEEEHHEITF